MNLEVAGRQGGKVTRTITAIREALERGEHVHVASRDGSWCVDGPADCPVRHRTITNTEQALRG